MLIQAEKGVNSEPDNRPHGPDRLAGIHLRFAGSPVGKNDRRFPDPTAGLAAAVENLLLKRITARNYAVQPGCAQFRHAVAPERAAGILGWNPQQQADDGVDPTTYETAGPGPMLRAAAADIARPDHHVVPFHAGQDGRDVARLMAEVGVHVQ